MSPRSPMPVTVALVALAALSLAAGARAASSDKMTLLQGDWPTGTGSVFTVSGTSGRLTRVSADDKASGYSKDDLLVQGLVYARTDALNGGEARAVFTGTCRSPVGRKGKSKVDWVVSDCELRVQLPSDSRKAGAKLVAVNGSPLISGQRPASAAPPPVLVSAAVVEAPPADPNDTTARRAMSPEELAAQDRASEQLNAEVNARNAAAAERDRKRDADYRAAKAAREAEILANQQAHEREMAAYRAKVAAAEAAAAKARADWEAAVAACKAGDKSKCAQP